MNAPDRMRRHGGRRLLPGPAVPGMAGRLVPPLFAAGSGFVLAAIALASAVAADRPTVLRVSAPYGPMPDAKAAITTAAEAGAKSFAVKLEEVALVDDPELLALIEAEVRDLVIAAVPGAEITFERCDKTCATP